MNTYTIQEIKAEISQYFQAKKYGMKPARAVRYAEQIQKMALEFAKNNEITDKWILKFRDGETILNNFGKKLYFKFG